jgi:phosphoglycerate dehydrogenase-like enzyme
MPDTVHILCAQHLDHGQLARLRQVSPRLDVRMVDSHRDVADALTPDTAVLFTSWGDFDLARAPGLRWVQTESAGVDHLQGTPLWASDITITSANGVHAVQIAEYVLTMLLAHAHHLPAMQRMQGRREWARGEQRERLEPRELRDATVGVIGYGAIGREVARLATAFGMRVLATSRNPNQSPRFDGWTPPGTGDPDGTLPERLYTLDDLPAMLAECDAVVLALPLSDRTRHLIGARELAAMQSHALLVNIGRGALIDQAVLINALEAGRIGGAALDVTDPEPLPGDSPLWAMNNVILTPHISGMSPRYNDRAVELFAQNLERYLAGKSLLNVVQRDLGY